MISRNTAVDALRGIAAVSVLIDHTLAAFPMFGGGAKTPIPFVQALIDSPLHLLWDGSAAVILFFVLSGYSLATMASKSGGRWRYYIASRLVRLYLPVIFAVALGWVIIQFRPAAEPIDSLWSIRAPDFTPLMAIQDMSLVHLSGEIGPLWSLQWEVIFSLTLPAVLLALRNWPKLFAWVLTATTLFVGLLISNPWVTYLPIFVIGVLMKQNEAALLERAGKSRIRDKVWCALGTFLALAVTAVPWILGPHDSMFSSSLMTTSMRVLGSIIVLLLAMTNETLQLALRGRVFSFLGFISFSLYLTHEPLVISLYRYLHGSLVAIPLSLLVSLAFGWLFYLTVEKRAHTLSRRIYKLGADRRQ